MAHQQGEEGHRYLQCFVESFEGEGQDPGSFHGLRTVAVHAGLQKVTGDEGQVLGVLAQLGLRAAALLPLLHQLVVLHCSVRAGRKTKAWTVNAPSSHVSSPVARLTEGRATDPNTDSPASALAVTPTAGL